MASPSELNARLGLFESFRVESAGRARKLTENWPLVIFYLEQSAMLQSLIMKSRECLGWNNRKGTKLSRWCSFESFSNTASQPSGYLGLRYSFSYLIAHINNKPEAEAEIFRETQKILHSASGSPLLVVVHLPCVVVDDFVVVFVKA